LVLAPKLMKQQRQLTKTVSQSKYILLYIIYIILLPLYLEQKLMKQQRPLMDTVSQSKCIILSEIRAPMAL